MSSSVVSFAKVAFAIINALTLSSNCALFASTLYSFAAVSVLAIRFLLPVMFFIAIAPNMLKITIVSTSATSVIPFFFYFYFHVLSTLSFDFFIINFN